jgi:hypothetical protein
MSSPRGRDPDRYGQDLADNKPIYEEKDSMLAALDIWIGSANNWEQDRKNKYRGRDNYQGDKRTNKYKNDGDYKDKNSKYHDRDDNYKRNDGKDNDYKRNDGKYKDDKRNDGKDNDYKRNDGKYKDDKRKDYKDTEKKRENYDDDKKNSYRKKRTLERVRFPVRQYKNVDRFPLSKYDRTFKSTPSL